jgi:flagellar P-ring protein precursor FlgI
MVANMLNQMGMRVTPAAVDPKNVAFVMVTAELPPYARKGMAIDVVVSSINGAKNLEGGTLLFAALRGADNKIHAIARGTILTGGILAGTTQGALVKTNHPTAGRVPNGGTVVGEDIEPEIAQDGILRLVLLNPDAKTAQAIQRKINDKLGDDTAWACNEGLVEVNLEQARGTARLAKYSDVDFLAELGAEEVDTDIPARVVVNSRTGTVVAGEYIRLDRVAIAHGNLQITIEARTEVSQPPPLAPAGAQTVPIEQQQLTVEEQKKAAGLRLVEGATVKQLVEALNALDVTTRDLISILQALKQAGALHAELIVL